MLVLYFGNRLRTSDWLAETDLGELAKAEAVVGVRVTQPEEPTAFTQTRVPQSRLAAADLWSAYGVKEADVFVVIDKFGNEYRRTTQKELAEVVKSTGKHFREVRLAVKELTDTASKARDDGKVAEAIAALHKVFKKDLVGYAEAEAASKLYADILATGRKQLAEAGTDQTRLADLQKTFAGTDLEVEIAQAIKKSGAQG